MRTSKSSASPFVVHVSRVIVVLVGTGLNLLVIELVTGWPTATHVTPQHVLIFCFWCAGLVSWALRFTRSHQSRFSLKTVLVAMAIIAVGFAHVLGTMLIFSWVCLAMVFDFGVRTSPSNSSVACRALQGTAGFIGLAHLARLMISAYLEAYQSYYNLYFFDPGGFRLTALGRVTCYSISALIATTFFGWWLCGRIQRHGLIDARTKSESQ